MAGKIPTTFAISCGRPTALWASQSSLPSYSPLSSCVLHFSHFPILSPIFHLFTLFPLPFSFSLFFHNFRAIFLHLLPLSAFPVFFGQSDASPCDPLVSNVLHEAQDNETNATCCERGFCLFLCIFRHMRKKGPN